MGYPGMSNFALAESNKAKVLEPFNYISNLPGKIFRVKLLKSLNQWFQLPEKDLDCLCKVMDILHNASLVIDDIEDGSEIRRGSPAAHIKYGIPSSINSANYAYFEALKIFIENFRSMNGVDLFVKYMLQMHEGQGMELHWRDGIMASNDDIIEIPTEKEYCDIIVRKTSGMFLFVAEMIKELTKNHDQDISKFGNDLGLYFQIRDDVMNLCSKQYESTKGFCEDIEEGKLSFPMIYGLNLPELAKDGRKSRLLQILRLRTHDREIKQEALDILENCGAISYSKEKLMDLEDEILSEIARLGGNEMLSELYDSTLSMSVSFK